MPAPVDADVQRAAEFLARHAVLLLGIGTSVALVALWAVIGVVTLLERRRHQVRQAFVWVVQHARTPPVVNRAIARTGAFMPSGYLALHLTLGLVATAAVSIFVVLAQEVAAGGEIALFDAAFAEALQAHSTPAWQRVFATVSWLGQVEVLTVITVLVAIVLLAIGSPMLAAGWAAAQAGGGLLNLALKETFERTRPEFADPMLAASSWSFPSGHAMGTFILVGVGSYLFVRWMPSWPAALVVVGLSLLWCIVMSFSRLYLGVHFASDVVAGIVCGAAWVAVCASALEVAVRSQRRRGPATGAGRDGRSWRRH